jgi:hypothetical protein
MKSCKTCAFEESSAEPCDVSCLECVRICRASPACLVCRACQGLPCLRARECAIERRAVPVPCRDCEDLSNWIPIGCIRVEDEILQDMCI